MLLLNVSRLPSKRKEKRYLKGSLQEKSGKYYAVFRVKGKQKWINLNISTARGNKRKAELALNELILQYNNSPNMFDKISFSEYVDKWLKNTENRVDIITYNGYKQIANNHIIPYFYEQDLALQDIKISDIEDYYKAKATSGRLDGKPGGLAYRTLKHHSAVLNLVFTYAMYDGLIKDNPCGYAKFPNIAKEKTKHVEFYTVEQCNKLLNSLKGKPLYNMVYITMLYGLRRSELLGLKWSAINFTNNTVTINHTVVNNGNITVEKNTTKNKSSNRTYPLLADVKKIFKEMLKEQEDNANLFGDCYNHNDYVFVREDGNRYNVSYPTKRLQIAIKRNNLPHIRWHDLRHSTASMLIEKGWHMKDISEWLGHSDIGTSMNIYGHISMEHKKELGNSLDGLLDN